MRSGSGSQPHETQASSEIEEGIYLTCDTNSSPHRLYFNSDVFREMGSQSGGIEENSGGRYPTRIQDANGDLEQVNYDQRVSGPSGNASAQITKIEDHQDRRRAPRCGVATIRWCRIRSGAIWQEQ